MDEVPTFDLPISLTANGERCLRSHLSVAWNQVTSWLQCRSSYASLRVWKIGNRAILKHLLLICVFVFLPSVCQPIGVASTVHAQEKPGSAQSESLVKQTRAGLVSGIRKLTPGDWGLMRSEIQNVSHQGKEVLSVVYFSSDTGVQYCRRVWIPPHSRRTVWIPVKVPEDIVDGKQGSEFANGEAFTSLIDQSGGAESVVRTDGRKLAKKTVFAVDTQKQITIQVTDPRKNAPLVVDGLTEDEIASQSFRAMRVANSLSEAVPNLSDRRVPIIPATLDPADQIIVRGNRLAEDAPGRTALRQWVQKGGRLWLMLDTMDEKTVQLILGDLNPVSYIDDVSLVDFRNQLSDAMLEEIKSISTSKPELPAQQQHELPIRFIRTIVEDVDVLMSIDGWPSVFTQDFGRGKILFTTVGVRALCEPKVIADDEKELFQIVYSPRPELKTIAQILLSKPEESVVDESTFTSLVQENVGYRVPGRTLILLILSAFCIALLLVGMTLAKANRLGQLIWVAPLIALLATLPLVAMGMASNNSVPATVVQTQFVESSPAGDDVYVTGLAGVFNTDQSNRLLASNSTSIYVPDRTGINSTWRMVWNDLDQVTWENVSIPSGLRLVPMESTLHAVEPIRANGTFDSAGFVGSIEGPLTNLRDGLVASSTHVSLAIDLPNSKEQNRLAGPIKNSLAPGQYTSAGILRDEQVRHQEIYRKMMDFQLTSGLAQQSKQVSLADRVEGKLDSSVSKVRTTKFPNKPSILVWADPLELGFEFNSEAKQTGDALIVAPIELHRPNPNETIRIPSVFLPYKSVIGGGSDGKSTAFDERTGTWLKRSRGTAVTLRFQLPQSVLPFKASQANLKIKLTAALRSINIKAGNKNALTDVAQINGETGIVECTFKDPSALQIDENGGLHIRLQVGEVSSTEQGQKIVQNVDWKIDYVELQLDGKYTPEE